MVKNFANLPSLRAEIKKYGVKLSMRGGKLLGRCPFHKEKTPSFFVYQDSDRERYHCYGCGAAGDVLDFICHIKGCTLTEVMKDHNLLVGIDYKSKAIFRREARIRAAQERFEKWLCQSIDNLCLLLRCCDQVLPKARLSDKFDLMIKKQWWEYYYHILMFDSLQAKRELYKDFKYGF